MEKQLIFIANSGCDATTYGIAEFTQEELKSFCRLIYNLNLNSYYGCMPKISLYYTNWENFKEVTNKEILEQNCYEDFYVENENRFWYNEKCYTYKNNGCYFYTDFKEVNLEEVFNVK